MIFGPGQARGGGVLVVGASQAGMQLAVSVRALDPDVPLTLVGAEPCLPYQRPPLSKQYLAGRMPLERTYFRDAAYFRERRIEVRTDTRVVAVDPHGGRAETSAGEVVRFDGLALATGGRPRRLFVPGADADGVHYLRDLVDATRLAGAFERAQRVVVVGGGFIGLEVAATARAAGKPVTVVEALDRLAARALSPVVSAFLVDAHRRRGTRIRLGTAVTGIETTDGRVRAVTLDDGTELPADLVLVAIGMVPRTELAEAMGLVCAGGIVVDAYCRTSDGRTVAAGDCTVSRHPRGAGPIRLESVQNAVDQATVAAATLVGRLSPYTALPWFWSDQGDLRLRMAGLWSDFDEVIVRGEPAAEQFSVVYLRGDRLIAIDSVNRPQDYRAARRALERGPVAAPPRGLTADPDRPLATLLG